MDKKHLVSVLDDSLVRHGFVRKSTTWCRPLEGVLQVFDLQRSAYGMQFYVNLCFVPSGMVVEGLPTPREYKCPIRIRLDAVFPGRREQIAGCFDLENPGVDDGQRVAAVAELVQQVVLPFMDPLKEPPALRQAIVQGAFDAGAVTLAAKEHLGIPG